MYIKNIHQQLTDECSMFILILHAHKHTQLSNGSLVLYCRYAAYYVICTQRLKLCYSYKHSWFVSLSVSFIKHYSVFSLTQVITIYIFLSYTVLINEFKYKIRAKLKFTSFCWYFMWELVTNTFVSKYVFCVI